MLEKVHGDTFYMLFDNENVSLRGIAPVALYEKFAGFYTHTHVKAGSAEAAPRPLSSEESFGGLTKLADVMKQHGFDGWVIIESDYWKLDKGWEEIFCQDKKFILESWK